MEGSSTLNFGQMKLTLPYHFGRPESLIWGVRGTILKRVCRKNYAIIAVDVNDVRQLFILFLLSGNYIHIA